MSHWQPPPPSVLGWDTPTAGARLAEERYVRLGAIGAGSMGEVVLGWDAWLDRNVALKTPHGPPGSPMEAALLREALLAARLDHPAIVSVLDLVRDADGRTVFVMRVARGRPLTAWLAEGQRGPVLRGVVAAAEAMAHAHERGVVHRDLSPHNVLLGERGEVSILDWGLAAQTGETAGSGGTAGYAAPEQLTGAAAAPMADVWSLGALLREAVGADASPELRAIVARATAPDPEQRYPHAGALHADLRRWEEGRLVEAYAYRPWQVLRHGLWVARRPLGLLLVVALGAVLQATSYTRSLQAEQARVVAAEAGARRALADARAGQAVAAWRMGDERQARRFASQALEAAPQPEAAGLLAATAAWPEVGVRELAPLPDCVRWLLPAAGDVAVCPMDAGTWVLPDGGQPWMFPGSVVEARRAGDELWLLDNFRALHRLEPLTGATRSVEPGPFALIDPLGVTLADRAGERLVDPGAPPSPCALRMHVAAQDPTGAWWMSCDDGSVHRVRRDGHVERVRPPGVDATAMLIPVGDELWSANRSGQLNRLLGPPGQIELGEPVRSAQEVPGRGLLVHGRNGRARLLDTTAVAWSLDLPAGLLAMAVRPDGRLRAIAERRLLEIELPASVPRPAWRSAHGISTLAWEPDSRHLRIGDGSGALHRVDWTASGGDTRLSWQRMVLKWVDVGPDGVVIATAMGEPSTFAWGADGAALPLASTLRQPLRRVVVLADGSFMVATYGGRVLRTVGEQVETLLHDENIGDLARDAAGRAVVVVASSGVSLWRDGVWSRVDEGAWWLGDVEGGQVVLVRRDEVRVRDEGGERTWTAPMLVTDLALAPDGRVLLGGQDGTVVVATPTGEVLARAPLHTDRVGALEVSPDGRWLASGGWDGTVRVVDLGGR